MEFTRKPFLLFIPFLILYVLIIVVFSTDQLIGDESRYLTIAHNYINLNLSEEYQVNIWNGPGYPIFISFFLALPVLYLKLINAVLLYLSLVYTYKTIVHFSNQKWALLFTVLLAAYYPFFTYLNYILTECFSWFLITMVIYHLSHYYDTNNRINKHFYLSTLFLFLLCMTKVLFGYVTLIFLILTLITKLINQTNRSTNKSLAVSTITLILCIPWLIYTYSLSGKYFYWSSAGGKSLYAMTSPYKSDLGDWKSTNELLKDEHHQKFIRGTLDMSMIQRDSAYMSKGIEHLKSHPSKFVQNWLANVGRLFISYPFSESQITIKTLLKAIPNVLIVVAVLITFFFLKLSLRPPTIFYQLSMYFGIYLFLSSLLSAYNRFFMITVPFWLIFIAISAYNSSILERIIQKDN